jgi:hypothetical protein
MSPGKRPVFASEENFFFLIKGLGYFTKPKIAKRRHLTPNDAKIGHSKPR